MTIAKKTSIFFCTMLLTSSAGGMNLCLSDLTDPVKKLRKSPIVFSRQEVQLVSGLLPVALQGTRLFLNASGYGHFIPDVLQNKIVNVLGTFVSMSATYLAMNELTPEKRLELLQKKRKKREETPSPSPIFQMKEHVMPILAKLDEANSDERPMLNGQLKDVITTTCGKYKKNYAFTPIGVGIKIGVLLKKFRAGEDQLKVLQMKAIQKKDVTQAAVYGGELEKAVQEITYLEKLNGSIENLPEYKEWIKIQAKVDDTKSKKEQMGTTTISAIIPMLIQPFMLLFQIALAYLGWLQ